MSGSRKKYVLISLVHIHQSYIFGSTSPNFDSGEKNLLKHLTDMLIQQTNCDVHFCFEEEQKMWGLVIILSARSSRKNIFTKTVFVAMFQYDMEESKKGKVNIIRNST